MGLVTRVLVTGASGFLGGYLVEKLKAERFGVIPTDIDITSRETVYLDVTDSQGTRSLFKTHKPDVLIHLAARCGSKGKGGGAESVKDPFNFFRVNILGTLNIFEACRLNNVNKVIYMSSFSPYGVVNEAIDESASFNPSNPYGYSKWCGELIARCYATGFGIHTIILRAPLICGKGQKELNALREFVLCVRESKPIVIFGDGMHTREWLHPTDVSAAFVDAIRYFQKMSSPFEVFVLGSNPISMLDLANLIVKNMGKGRIEFRSDGTNVFSQYTNTAKARKILGWQAKTSIEDIVKEVIVDIA